MSSSRIAPMCRRCRSVRSIRLTRPTCGPGWMANARRATNFSQSRITPTSRMAACIRPTSTSMGGRSTEPMQNPGTAMSRSSRSSRSRGNRKPILCSPNDEFANFEILTYLLGDPAGRIPHVIGSYARQALEDGLALEDTKGFNPYKFGFGAASDSHDTGVAYRQDNFFGAHGIADGTIETRMSGHLFAGLDVRLEGPAGLTGVWAEENTRESIFNAMKRKETF